MSTNLSIVIPTVQRQPILRRVLDRLERQDIDLESIEVIVVADAAEPDVGAVRAAVGDRPFAARVMSADEPGASPARNVGWRAAEAPLVLFLDDDVLPEPGMVGEHLAWHRRYPQREIGVLGRVRWADELRVTPFMRWLEDGVQFDYPNIEGVEAGWGRFYTANASVKRELITRVGGFDEERLPFGYEDLDLAYRMKGLGFRLLYNPLASAEHLHSMDLAFWRRRVRRLAAAERQFTRLHPEVPPYFHNLFSDAVARPPARGRGATLIRLVPRRFPWLGNYVWTSADVHYRQALAPAFLEAWEADPGPPAGGRVAPYRLEREAVSSGGSDPGGPK